METALASTTKRLENAALGLLGLPIILGLALIGYVWKKLES
jgi:hypothetical protein